MSRHIVFLVAFLLALPVVASGPAASTLVVEIDGIGEGKGRLAVFLYDSEEAWAGTRDTLAVQRLVPDGSGRARVRFAGLRAGRYGVMVLHDKDGNGRFDTVLGVPTDDYGFSNNPRVFKRPGFRQIAFELAEPGTTIHVRMR